MTTYYIDITSGSLRTYLQIIAFLSGGEMAGCAFGAGDELPGMWFNGTKEDAEKLCDHISTVTHEAVDIYDEDATLVASTLPATPTTPTPSDDGEYLCLISPSSDGGVKRRWMVVNWVNGAWLLNDLWRVDRWLHLPRMI